MTSVPPTELTMRPFSGQALFPFLLIGLYLLCFALQSQLLLNWDVAWLMHAAQTLQAGGVYGNDFLEINPPLILYLYRPVIWLVQYTSMLPATALRLYVFCLASLSLVFCHTSLRAVFPATDQTLRQYTLLLMAIVLLLLPMQEFGQREHLLMIFSLPYFLLVSRRLTGQPPATGNAIVTGLFASLGFALKPYFLIAPLLVELYYLRQQRRFTACIRPETIVIASAIVGYGIFVLLLHANYWQIMIPLMRRIAYYAAYSAGWAALFSNVYVIFTLLILFFALTQTSSRSPYQPLLSVLLLAMVGMLIAYLVQLTPWFYHASPAYQLATLLAALCLLQLFTRTPAEHSQWWLALGTGLIVISLLWGTDAWRHANTLPLYGAFVILVMMLYPLTAQQNSTRRLVRSVAGASIITVILSYPIINATQTYQYAVNKQRDLAPLTTFLRLHAWHQPVYYLANSATNTLPVMIAAETRIATRMQDAGWIPCFLRQHAADSATQSNDQTYLIHNIVLDINQHQPAYILVDRQAFDYVRYLSQDAAFREAFQHYHYLLTLSQAATYQFDIYQRTQTE